MKTEIPVRIIQDEQMEKQLERQFTRKEIPNEIQEEEKTIEKSISLDYKTWILIFLFVVMFALSVWYLLRDTDLQDLLTNRQLELKSIKNQENIIEKAEKSISWSYVKIEKIDSDLKTRYKITIQ